MTGGRKYNIPVAGSEWAKKTSDITMIENNADAERLLKTYHFLVECDANGEVGENKYRKEDNAQVVGKIPETIDIPIEKAPRKDSIQKRSSLTRTEEEL